VYQRERKDKEGKRIKQSLRIARKNPGKETRRVKGETVPSKTTEKKRDGMVGANEDPAGITPSRKKKSVPEKKTEIVQKKDQAQVPDSKSRTIREKVRSRKVHMNKTPGISESPVPVAANVKK